MVTPASRSFPRTWGATLGTGHFLPSPRPSPSRGEGTGEPLRFVGPHLMRPKGLPAHAGSIRSGEWFGHFPQMMAA